MPRIEIELTSSRPDGVWTWRAAGARHPKGTLEPSLLYPGAKVGDVVRADCDVDLDGTRVTAVLPTRQKRAEPERLAITGSGREELLVTQDGRAPSDQERSGRGDRRGGGGRSDRGDRPGRPRPAGDGARPGGDRRPGGRPSGERGARPDGARPERRPERREGARPEGARPEGARPEGDRGARRPSARDRPRPDRSRSEPAAGVPGRDRSSRDRGDQAGRARTPAAPAPSRPRAKRLQPARVHRDAVLAELAPEERPVAELVLRGGIPSVRQAVDEQNARAREAGEPQVRADALVTLAEGLLPRLRAAEWRDRADAAAADVDEIGLRDLRAVVAGSDAASRDDECRALLSTLREALERRIGLEQESWLAEIRQSLADGRVVRALRVSGRPPEPGVRFPAELAEELSRTAGAAMTPETTPDRWVALLDAVVASPVRRTVAPQGLPAERAEDLERALRLAAPRVPALQALLGGPPRPPAPRRPQPPGADGRPRPPRGDRRPPRPPAPRPPAPPPGASTPAPPVTPAADGPAPEIATPPTDTPAAPEPAPVAAEAPVAPEPPVAEQPAAEQPPTTAEERSGDDGDDAVLVEELR